MFTRSTTSCVLTTEFIDTTLTVVRDTLLPEAASVAGRSRILIDGLALNQRLPPPLLRVAHGEKPDTLDSSRANYKVGHLCQFVTYPHILISKTSAVWLTAPHLTEYCF